VYGLCSWVGTHVKNDDVFGGKVEPEAGGGPCVLGFEINVIKRAPTGNPFGGNWEGWIGLGRLNLDIFDGYSIDQSEASVGSECIFNAINPNASKKPRDMVCRTTLTGTNTNISILYRPRPTVTYRYLYSLRARS
jgi:hypothetical protein